ncbi:RagB/SusD family nutrient uptake outer membrane protein [Pedobacter sp. SD-b]|uniref:RagB/SusD family nutrient uptake outer membrane protein n=1 Tax=Pedobacter segetis TaxID=2793069 RepID=A0ABS1BLC4_9SPHI|nr:RagB/SusD family nutrient uptake outer membrane protein [Pedobacter segetis]MBK0383577.1 RagB/SusD family nutrient uptake outer membrane protein [Pedobacter segetis]
MKYSLILTKLTLLLLLGTLVVSCNSLLDKTPITEYASSNFWQEPAQASAALTGAYKSLQTTLNTEFMYYGEGRADIDSLLTANDISAISVNTNALSPNVNFADWGGFYSVIKQANLIIANIKLMKDKGYYNSSNTAEYNRVLGQAYGLRGMCYFYMTRIWGDVPLITEPITNTTDITSFKTPRTDTLEVYKVVANDLYSARQLLPASYSDATKTRITLTKGGIDAILTDYYMWRNNIDSALVFSQNVISNTTQYKLAGLYSSDVDLFASGTPANAIDNTDYARMFINGYSTESIFEIDYNYLERTSSGISGIYGGGVGVALFVASPRMLVKFGRFERDGRVLASLRSSVQVYKYFPKGTYDRVTENDKNVMLYRLADIILMRAEALNAKGRRAEAWTLLKKIRERTFGPSIITNISNDPVLGPTGTNEQDQFMAISTSEAEDVLLDERARELCFEGKRWYDLVRTGRVYSVMKDRYKNNVLVAKGITDPANILWPIAISVIKQNPLIEQNSYYK